MVNKGSGVILNSIILNDEREIEYNLHSGFVRQNCSCENDWCGSRSVNVQLDINIATLSLQ